MYVPYIFGRHLCSYLIYFVFWIHLFKFWYFCYVEGNVAFEWKWKKELFLALLRILITPLVSSNSSLVSQLGTDKRRKNGKAETLYSDEHKLEWYREVTTEEYNIIHMTNTKQIYKYIDIQYLCYLSTKHLSHLHDKYVVVPGDNTPNNMVFMCKPYYIDCLLKELVIDNSLGNPTILIKVLGNHMSVLCSFWNFNQRSRNGSTVTLLNYWITQEFSQKVLYCCICQMLLNLFPTYQYIFYQRSKLGFRVTATVAT